MNVNPLYQVFLNQELLSKQQVYQFIAETAAPWLTPEEKKQIEESLVNREKMGSNQIAEQIVLPHLENALLKKSEIYLIGLKTEIQEWTADIKQVKLIIVILLKENEQLKVKKEISRFTRKLANEDFLEKLLRLKTETDFYKIIEKFEEEKIMKIVGVAACTVGIAHTYIAQEKLENAAKKAGVEIHVETQGTIGIENKLTDEQIKEADIVILAIDVKISGRERFDGKRIIQVPTEVAVKSPTKLIEKAEEVMTQEK